MTILKTLETQMGAGIAPTFEQMEEALAVALKERNQFESMTREMAGWMSKIVFAHRKEDAIGVKAVLDAFVKERVKIVDHTNQSGSVH